MVGDDAGLDRLSGARLPPAQDRFASWPPLRARLGLFAFIAILIASAFAPISAGRSTVKTTGFAELIAGAGADGPQRPRDDDLALYDRAIERIQAGENYYDFIHEEHRRADYPVRPGLAVRLPTLAYIDAALGKTGQTIAAILLMFAVLWAWWGRLKDEGVPPRLRRIALAFVFLGASLGLNRYYFVLHELWAGMLVALAFGLHRPGRKWGAALAVTALALAIRETVLPFALLLAASAFWRRDWKEGAAWSALVIVFLAALAWHLSIVSAHVLPTDREGPDWLVLRGLSGWLSNIALSSNLRFLPHWLAGPAIVFMVLGWAGWKTDAGAFGALLFLGYGLAFMIAGRPDNFYWGAVIAPTMFVGLAFAPQAAQSLFRAARAK